MASQAERTQVVRGRIASLTAARNSLQDKAAQLVTVPDNTGAQPGIKSLEQNEETLIAQRMATISDNLLSDAQTLLELIDFESESVRNGSFESFRGLVNPVQPPYGTSDTFGAPRSGHSHEGIDIFGKRGLPIRATVDGVLRDVKKTPIGGRIAYITSPDGTYYYYAHLEDWAPGIKDGASVVAGQVIGFLGRTGNAEATPYHLHFEMHPLGGGPINPYPIINAVQKRDKKLFAAWTIPIAELCAIEAAASEEALTRSTALPLDGETPTTTAKPKPEPKPTPTLYTTSTTIATSVCPAPKPAKPAKPAKVNKRAKKR